MSSEIFKTLSLVKAEKLNNNVVDYARELVQRESVTPADAGCQSWLEKKVKALGATVTRFKTQDVSNFIAVIDKGEGPNVAFCGHTDVVPAGDLSKWTFLPYSAHIENGVMYGRGIADMKGGIAAFIAAAELLVNDRTFEGKLWLFITSDEEGEAEHGSRAIVDYLKAQGVVLDYCIVGEPTAKQTIGDVVKIGRRGAISFDIDITGKAAHVAYPSHGINAIHLMSQVIGNLNEYHWDKGNEDCPGTSLQVTHFDSGDWTDNVIPSKASISLNIRYSYKYTEPRIKEMVEKAVSTVTEEYVIKSYRSCVPYFCEESSSADSLKDIVRKAIKEDFDIDCTFSTSGGTSDGRFFKEICSQIIEVGLPNKTIHQVNESVAVAQLERLSYLYFSIFNKLLSRERMNTSKENQHEVCV
ncbi:hypothetical protein PULV_a3981 [Pseudoalteromonas ulvae UL12]|uniref:succinyl-diaminopimelate desuccinylase n=1 Tax=Pseudoalteromonas ulvae TaxID=107327 RepID=UPI00186B7474|nr:succinyl-diaminopimelate desuccinylase [Pseudoalteromonas ulvae]MBE0362174.1 hypothetical protein [Pseudoalteromonas ulvae UL12]